MNLKKVLVMFCAAVVLSSNIVFASGENNITVTLDGKMLNFDVPPQVIQDRTLVPLRGILEALGYSVSWYESDERIEAVSKENTIILHIGNKEVKHNNNIVQSDVAPQVIQDRTLVPLRLIAECSGIIVDWNSETNTVILLSNAKPSKEDSNVVESDSKTSNEDSNVVESDVEEEIKEFYCSTSLKKSMMKFGAEYRIVFELTASGKNGVEPYKYSFEVVQGNKTIAKTKYSNDNVFSSTITGTSECFVRVYVKDSKGNVAETAHIIYVNE